MVRGLGLRVEGLELRVLAFKVQGLGSRVWSLSVFGGVHWRFLEGFGFKGVGGYVVGERRAVLVLFEPLLYRPSAV